MRESERREASAAFMPSMKRASVAARPSLLVEDQTNDEVAAIGAPLTGGIHHG